MTRRHPHAYTITLIVVLAVVLAASSQRTFAAQQQPEEDKFVYPLLKVKPIRRV
jgi:hypothetical protein